MKITKITVTGADDSVTPHDLIRLAERFPLVEFGILLSRRSQGSSRFPSPAWLKAFMKVSDGLQFSGHICGAWVREILLGKWPIGELRDLLGEGFFERFARWQLNTHGMSHKFEPAFIDSIGTGPRGIIFQYDEKNNALVEAAKSACHTNIAALFDLSHGAGVLPSQWPLPLDGIPCGYAGGLEAMNVSDQCRKLHSVVGTAEIWIDAETHLRTGNDRLFDLTEVEAFIINALPYTV